MNARFNRILVPVDFSRESERALEHAIALAGTAGARVELLHVVEDPIASGAWGAEAYVVSVPGLIEDLVEQATRRLDIIKTDNEIRGVPMDVRVVTGPAARTIVATADADACDLIVMGTHGRGGFSHMLLGSVAERVIRTAPCPVMTVRAEKAAGSEHTTPAAEMVAS